MPIKQIVKKNISTEVFEQIKHNIVSGEWKPGEKILSENELGNLFGVSRVSIRAALQKLCVLGLLTTSMRSWSKSAKNLILYKVNTIIKDILTSHQIKIQGIMGPTLALKYHPAILEAVKKGIPIWQASLWRSI